MQFRLPKLRSQVAILSPTEQSEKIHKQVRQLRKNPEALDDLAIELFLRIVGIFFTLSEETRANEKYATAVKEFLQLRQFIDVQLASDDGRNFAKYEMSDYVHNLHLLLIEIVNLDYLEANIHNVREEYRNHVGDIAYRIYTLSKSFTFLEKYRDKAPNDSEFLLIKDTYEDKLRVDYGNIINEIRKARLYEVHIEGTRRYLIKKALHVLVLLCIVPFVIIISYAAYGYIQENDRQDIAGLVLFSTAAIAGATGSFISVVLRIQGVRDNTQLAQNIFAFKYSQTTVQIAPLTGMIFGILLSFVIYGGLIGGTMFPKISTEPNGEFTEYISVLNNIGNLSKLLVWSFIAGFSERLIPDMVDRLSDKARKADEKLVG